MNAIPKCGMANEKFKIQFAGVLLHHQQLETTDPSRKGSSIMAGWQALNILIASDNRDYVILSRQAGVV